MSLLHVLCKKGLTFLLVCSILLLFSLPGGGAARLHAQSLQQSDAQQQEYEVILLTSPAQLSDSEGRGVGVGQSVGRGRIAGAPDPDDTHALLWSQIGGAGIDLHPQGFRFSSALDTDGQRQVGYGNGTPTGFHQHALLWNGAAAGYIDLHPSEGWTDSIARAIAGDQQVGNINYYFQTTYEIITVEHAALWRGSAASVVDLHPNGIGCARSYANNTDGARQVGYGYFDAPSNTSPYRALLWSGTAASAVVLHPSGFTHSFAEGVSGNEQVGYAFDVFSEEGTHALLWHGTAASVVDLHPAGYSGTTAWATNGTMQVGSGGTPNDPYHSHAVRWSGTAASVFDLHALLPSGEFDNSIAYDIDAVGNIVGLAQRPDGSTVGVLWRRASTINNAPSVQIINPTYGQVLHYSAPIQLMAQAADTDGSVAQVEFYAENKLVGTVAVGTNGMYQYNWQMGLRRPGKYRLRARVTDNLGAVTWSQMVLVRIVP